MADHDEPRDAWLKKALHHAPDTTPVPPSVRDTILRASRTPRPAPVATVPWWSRLSAWLVRPQVAAGFASVAMVTVAGLLWHDEPLPPMPASTPPAAVETPSANVPAPPPEAPPVIERAAEKSEPAPARSAPPPRPPAPKAREMAPPVMKPAPAADAAARSEAPVMEAAVPPPPSPAPAPTVAMAPPAPVPEPMAERRAAAAEAERADTQRKAMAPSGALRRQAAPAAEAFAPAPVAIRLADVRSAVAATPSRWTWQRQAGGTRPADAALNDWLALLDVSAGAGWRASTGPRTGAAEVHLLFDGQPVQRWVVTDQAVFWFSPSGVWTAPVGAPAARRLLEALETLP